MGDLSYDSESNLDAEKELSALPKSPFGRFTCDVWKLYDGILLDCIEKWEPAGDTFLAGMDSGLYERSRDVSDDEFSMCDWNELHCGLFDIFAANMPSFCRLSCLSTDVAFRYAKINLQQYKYHRKINTHTGEGGGGKEKQMYEIKKIIVNTRNFLLLLLFINIK